MSCGCGTPWCCGDPCVTTTVTACIGEDPGMATQGRYLALYDTQFRLRRLQSATGVLEALLDGSGNIVLRFTNSPTVAYTTMPLGLDVPFTGLLAAVGDQSITKKLAPTAQGFLRANADGTWQTTTLPAAVVPDPLTLTTLNASNGNITDLTTTGTVIFDNLPTDTAVQALGLNAAGELVIPSGSSSAALGGTKIAKYYESPTFETLGSTPNADKNNGEFLIIGNRIFDPDVIASVTDQTTLRIEQAGNYLVHWGGCVGRVLSLGVDTDRFNASIVLMKNGAHVSNGNQRDLRIGFKDALSFSGIYADDFAVGDTIKVRFDTNLLNAQVANVREINVVFQKVS